MIRVKSNERHDIKKFIHWCKKKTFRIAMEIVETSLWDSHNCCLNNEWFNSFFIGAVFGRMTAKLVNIWIKMLIRLVCRVLIYLNKYLNNLLSYFYIMTPISSLTFSAFSSPLFFRYLHTENEIKKFFLLLYLHICCRTNK